MLEERFELYTRLNTDIEEDADRRRRGGGVYSNAVKVDFIRLRASVHAAALLEFIINTAVEQPHTLVSDGAGIAGGGGAVGSPAGGAATPPPAAASSTTAAAAGAAGRTASSSTMTSAASPAPYNASPPSGFDENASSFIVGSSGGASPAAGASGSAAGNGLTSPSTASISLSATPAPQGPHPPLPPMPSSTAAAAAALTLGQLLERHKVMHPREMTEEGLGLFPPAMSKRYHRYDALDAKHNPSGALGADILRVFLQRTGANDGLLFASLLRPMLERIEYASLHVTATEMSIPIVGSHPNEWREASRWLRSQGLNSGARTRWCVDIVRNEQSRADCAPNCKTYADQLRHLFYPMLMATLCPNDPEWADVAAVLKNVTTLTITSDEAVKTLDKPLPPDELPFSGPADDYYFFYYVWANLATVNALRKRNGLNTINFAPTCPFSCGHLDHLASAFLLADAIFDGTKLASCWLLQYLFMFARIGVIMSPLMDNSTHVNYFDHPFPTFFKRGLLVTLASIDPLHYHHNPAAIVEEYATAQKIFRLAPMDMCEIARNSCLISNFAHETKSSWLGSQYQNVFEGNDIARTNVSDSRLYFRHDCLLHEQGLINYLLTDRGKNTDHPHIVSLIRPRMRGIASSGSGGGSSSNANGGAIGRLGGIEAATERDSAGGKSAAADMDTRIMYPRIDIVGPADSASAFTQVGEMLQAAIALRNRFDINVKSDAAVEDVFRKKTFNEAIHEYNSYHGVFQISRIGRPPDGFRPPLKEYRDAMLKVREIVVNTPEVARLATHRLELLDHKFRMHRAMNVALEAGEMKNKARDNRDIFTAHKVDNNVHTTAGMNSRTLLEFFVEKATNNGHDVVCEDPLTSSPVTLKEMLAKLKIDPNRVAVDELHSLVQTNQQIRNIFLSTDNFMQGRYFAELTKRTLDLYKLDEYTFSESRLQIFGRDANEWHNLAMWFDRYGMASHQNRWVVHLPRGYAKLKRQRVVKNFAEYLDNIFQPLWEVSLHPAQDPKFHYFLTHVSGFDCVDDESKVDLPLEFKEPHDWNTDQSPPYSYYMYYYWANLMSLNSFRAKRGLGTFTFRPQCGEQGDVDHLISGFLLASAINQGVTLRHYPAMEYLYYIAQIPIAMAPLSNTRNSIDYLDNPFQRFYFRGLRVSLATDQPLFTHFTREPLIEEYSIASKIFTLESNDLCEIARNSVLQSGFGPAWRRRALGRLHYLNSTLGNDVQRSRVSDVRVAYRFEMYHAEMDFVDELLSSSHLNVTIQRAILSYAEEMAEYERALEENLEGSDEDEDGGGAGGALFGGQKRSLKAASLHDRQRQLILAKQHEVATKQKELLLLRTCAEQLSTENDTIAMQIKRIQERLEKEALALRADLVNEDEADGADDDEYGNYDEGEDYYYRY